MFEDEPGCNASPKREVAFNRCAEHGVERQGMAVRWICSGLERSVEWYPVDWLHRDRPRVRIGAPLMERRCRDRVTGERRIQRGATVTAEHSAKSFE